MSIWKFRDQNCVLPAADAGQSCQNMLENPGGKSDQKRRLSCKQPSRWIITVIWTFWSGFVVAAFFKQQTSYSWNQNLVAQTVDFQLLPCQWNRLLLLPAGGCCHQIWQTAIMSAPYPVKVKMCWMGKDWSFKSELLSHHYRAQDEGYYSIVRITLALKLFAGWQWNNSRGKHQEMWNLSVTVVNFCLQKLD